jgi:hypothetical protein
VLGGGFCGDGHGGLLLCPILPPHMILQEAVAY